MVTVPRKKFSLILVLLFALLLSLLGVKGDTTTTDEDSITIDGQVFEASDFIDSSLEFYIEGDPRLADHMGILMAILDMAQLKYVIELVEIDGETYKCIVIETTDPEELKKEMKRKSNQLVQSMGGNGRRDGGTRRRQLGTITESTVVQGTDALEKHTVDVRFTTNGLLAYLSTTECRFCWVDNTDQRRFLELNAPDPDLTIEEQVFEAKKTMLNRHAILTRKKETISEEDFKNIAGNVMDAINTAILKNDNDNEDDESPNLDSTLQRTSCVCITWPFGVKQFYPHTERCRRKCPEHHNLFERRDNNDNNNNNNNNGGIRG